MRFYASMNAWREKGKERMVGSLGLMINRITMAMEIKKKRHYEITH